jgi:hypothetical protein
VTDEVAVELTLTRSAGRLLDLSGLGRLPAVNDALLSGPIDWARACVFTDELAVVDDAIAAAIAAEIVDRAAGWTTGQLRVALARAVLAADPAAAGRRRAQARKDTRVELWREPSGNAALAGRELQPSSALLLDRKLDADADWLAACGVPGTKDERRALAYTTLLSGRDLAAILDDPASWPQRDELAGGAGGPADAGDGGPAPGTRANCDGAGGPACRDRGQAGLAANARGRAGSGATPAAGSIHLTMPVSAWLGGGEPGEVAGYGPVDAVAGPSRRRAGTSPRTSPAT